MYELCYDFHWVPRGVSKCLRDLHKIQETTLCVACSGCQGRSNEWVAWSRHRMVSGYPTIDAQRTSLPLTLQNALQGSFQTPKLWINVQCGSRPSISSKDNWDSFWKEIDDSPKCRQGFSQKFPTLHGKFRLCVASSQLSCVQGGLESQSDGRMFSFCFIWDLHQIYISWNLETSRKL